jgi:hypothetical protein
LVENQIRPLELKEIVEIGIQVADALRRRHQRASSMTLSPPTSSLPERQAKVLDFDWLRPLQTMNFQSAIDRRKPGPEPGFCWVRSST